MDSKECRVYAGTYADDGEESIFLFQLNSETGELHKERGFVAGKKPSYMVLNEQQTFLYSVNEKKEDGSVCSFSVDNQNGDLKLLNRISSLGGEPVHITISDNGKVIIVANYQTGNVTVFPILKDGRLGEASNLEQHQGSGPDKERQDSAHAHYTAFSPDRKFVFVIDLGLDKILKYFLNEEEAKLVSAEQAVAFVAEPGSGPRQLSFHPNGKYAYLINELKSIVIALSYDKESGDFTEIDTISTIPEDFKENNQCGGIRVSPNGKFLYCSNRGHNSIAVFGIHPIEGKLSHLQTISSGGDWPREFAVDPEGKILLAANQESDSIVSYKIDQGTGKLINTEHKTSLIKPVFLKII